MSAEVAPGLEDILQCSS